MQPSATLAAPRARFRRGLPTLPTNARWPARAQTRARVRLGARCNEAKYSAVVVPLRSSRATRDCVHRSVGALVSLKTAFLCAACCRHHQTSGGAHAIVSSGSQTPCARAS